jgi:hypothetical protein
MPSNSTIEATSSAGATFTFTPSASDTVDGTVSVICTKASGSTFAIGNTTVNCTATDSHGNSAPQKSFTVTVRDTTPPVISGVPSTITKEATSSSGAVATYTLPTANDLVSGAVSVNCSPTSGSTFALGNTNVGCLATDGYGNTAGASFTVVVRDTTPPVFSGVPSTIILEATSPSGAVATYTKPNATDIVDGTTVVGCTVASGATFPLGNTTVDCTTIDSSSNSNLVSFIVSIRDTTPPNMTGVPSNKVAEATSPAGATVTYTSPTATDIVSGSVSVNCTPLSGSTFALGSKSVVCTATDSNKNFVVGSFVISVRDTTKPVISGVPANFSVEATSPAGAVATYTLPTVTDVVSTNLTANCSPVSGSTFALGSNVVTCTAMDSSNNTAIAKTFLINVVDTTPPVISGVPSTIVVEAVSSAGAIATYTTPTATDLVSGAVSVTCSKASGSNFALGNTTVTCNATDAASNTATSSFRVSVVDTTPPVISGLPTNNTREATSPAGATFTYTTPTASDLVDGTVSVNCSKASGTIFALGNTTVNCTAKDAKNNLASSSFRVSVVDTTPPVINTTLTTITVEATSSSGAVVTYATPTATDIVDGNVVVNCNYASNTTFALGSTMVSCIAVDTRGNGVWSAFIVTVRDTIAPNITSTPANITQGSSTPAGAVINFVTPNATDAVSGNITTNCSKASGSVFAVGNTLVNCTATDSSGNVASVTFMVTITANPYFTSLGPIIAYDNVVLNYAIGVNDTGGNTVVGLTVNNPNFTINNATFVFTNRTTLVAGTYPVVVTAFNNLGMNASRAVLVTILAPYQQYVVNSTEVVQTNKTEMIVNQGSNTLNNIILPSTITTSPMYVNFTALLSGTTVTMISDLSLITSNTNTYTMFLPSGTVVTGDATWDGRLRFPIINSAVYTIAGGNVVMVMDVGGNSPLTFSQPVKIVLGGMSGRRAAWAYGTTVLTDIPTVCDSATAPTNINAVGPKECYISSGSDLLIWTYHSTAFAAYDVIVPASTPSGGGGGGGGGSSYTCPSNWTACVDGVQTRNCTSGSRWRLETSNCTMPVKSSVSTTPKVNVTSNLTNATGKVSGADALKNAKPNTYSIKKITSNVVSDIGSALSGAPNIVIPALAIAMLLLIGGVYLFYHYKNKGMDTKSKRR